MRFCCERQDFLQNSKEAHSQNKTPKSSFTFSANRNLRNMMNLGNTDPV